VLKGLRDRWQFPDSVVQRADVVVDETGKHVRSSPPPANNVATKPIAAAEATNPK